jgi:hypothetical protein
LSSPRTHYNSYRVNAEISLNISADLIFYLKTRVQHIGHYSGLNQTKISEQINVTLFDAEYAIILLKKQTASHKPQPRTPNHVKVKLK